MCVYIYDREREDLGTLLTHYEDKGFVFDFLPVPTLYATTAVWFVGKERVNPLHGELIDCQLPFKGRNRGGARQ